MAKFKPKLLKLKGDFMLIQFSVGNYLSFKEIATLSMEATAIKELRDSNTISMSQKSILRSSVLYGKNASGKSNFISAMKFMDYFVMSSVKNLSEDENEDVIFDKYYKLSTDSKKKPSFFEITISIDNCLYRYGFELGRNSVESEWLFVVPENKIKEKVLFTRNKNTYKISPTFEKNKDLTDKTRKEALFIGVAAIFNNSIAKKIRNWFLDFNVLNGHNDNRISTVKHIKNNKELITTINKFLCSLDTDIEKIEIVEGKPDDSLLKFIDATDMPNDIRNNFIDGITTRVNTYHGVYDSKLKRVGTEKFELDADESAGTKKIFNFAYPILDTLSKGKVLVIDELESKLHHKITQNLIKLFNSPDSNPNNAQLIFATHDTSLLNKNYLRRDQMWFVEKNKYGASKVFSLVEFIEENKKVRNDASFERDYLEGRYGAVPVISKELSNIVSKDD